MWRVVAWGVAVIVGLIVGCGDSGVYCREGPAHPVVKCDSYSQNSDGGAD